MIGEIRTAAIPWIDPRTQRPQSKRRPCLVIGQVDSLDCLVLPISSITHSCDRDPLYDIELDINIYPDTHLNHTSYVRTHKSTVVNSQNLGPCIADVKAVYPELFGEIIDSYRAFTWSMTETAYGAIDINT